MPMMSAADMRDPLFKGEDEDMGEESALEDTWTWSAPFSVYTHFLCGYIYSVFPTICESESPQDPLS